MSNEERDNPGIKVPPPLIYLLPLVLGLILDRKAHVPFLPSGVVRIIGWPLIGGGVLIGGWWRKTMRDADAPVRTDRLVPRLTTAGPFGYSRNPLSSSRSVSSEVSNCQKLMSFMSTTSSRLTL
jgi:protein-S-isoprenylcysteine O-methyltransferase Ste14